MALIKCPECGKKISAQSATCINCGHPINDGSASQPTKAKAKKRGGCLKTILFIVAILAAIGYFQSKSGVDKPASVTTPLQQTESTKQSSTAKPAITFHTADEACKKLIPILEHEGIPSNAKIQSIAVKDGNMTITVALGDSNADQINNVGHYSNSIIECVLEHPELDNIWGRINIEYVGVATMFADRKDAVTNEHGRYIPEKHYEITPTKALTATVDGDGKATPQAATSVADDTFVQLNDFIRRHDAAMDHLKMMENYGFDGRIGDNYQIKTGPVNDTVTYSIGNSDDTAVVITMPTGTRAINGIAAILAWRGDIKQPKMLLEVMTSLAYGSGICTEIDGSHGITMVMDELNLYAADAFAFGKNGEYSANGIYMSYESSKNLSAIYLYVRKEE